MNFDIDSPIIDAGIRALFGHHPERGGPEARQAVFSVLTAVEDYLEREPLTHEEAEAKLSEFMSALLGVELRGVKVSRPADINVKLEYDEFLMDLVDPMASFRAPPNIRREIVLHMTFEAGAFEKKEQEN